MATDGTSEGYIGDGIPTADRMPIDSICMSLKLYRNELMKIGGGQALMYIDILLERTKELEDAHKSCECKYEEKKSGVMIRSETDPLLVMKMAVSVADVILYRFRCGETVVLSDHELTALELVLDMTKENLQALSDIVGK